MPFNVKLCTIDTILTRFCAFVNSSLGGIGSSYLYEHRGPKYPAVLSSVSAIAGCFPLWGLVNLNFNAGNGDDDTTNFFVVGLISALAGLLSAITGPIVKSTLQNVTLPHMRGQVSWI